MNPVYSCRFLLFLLLLLPLTLPAQPPTDWAPFPPETRRDYEWGPDTLITMRSGMWSEYYDGSEFHDFYHLSLGFEDADSALWVSCGAVTYKVEHGLWGDTVRPAAPGVWLISMEDGAEVVLKPQAQLMQPWLYDSVAGISAQVHSRLYVPVLGQMDSVAVILLSTNDTIHIGKHSGWIYGKPPEAMRRAGMQCKTAVLKSIHETNQGQRNADFYDVFDFDPGDVFEYRDWTTYGVPDLYYKHVILNVISSGPSGYRYQVYRQRFQYGGAVFAPDTIILSYDTADYPELLHTYMQFGTEYDQMNNWLNVLQFRDSMYYGREEIRYQRMYAGCLNWFNQPGSLSGSICVMEARNFREGTGLIWSHYSNFGDEITELIFCRKAVSRDSMGAPFYFLNQVLGNDATQAASARFYPNPARDAVQLDFGLEQAVPEWIRISDAQGRELRTIRMEPRLARQSVTLQDLPAGMLLLEYEGPAGRQVLRCIHMP